MLAQMHRPHAQNNHIMPRFRPAADPRMSPHHSVARPVGVERSEPRALVLHRPFCEPRDAERPDNSASTLLPWADPYIASLHRRHEGELRRERRIG